MTRERFHETLERIEFDILEMGELAGRSATQAVDALSRRDVAAADVVIQADDAIDEKYLLIDSTLLEILALQTPVAGDLRLISAMLHINHHLERIGDQSVNIAKISKLTTTLPASSMILTQIEEMGALAAEMVRTAMEAFARRDLESCLKLPAMDDPLDRLNHGMHREVLALSGDPEKLEWGMRMTIVARALERVGDNAVDVGEQTGFLLTGEYREFTDASHAVVVPEAPDQDG